ncbi:MAG: helix-turn-helix transcriptional regulator, partial [Lachnospiraceae bacterium]|nr:helix-turn-helix transcriptional regulator [Lachnospiraceae bacterium]
MDRKKILCETLKKYRKNHGYSVEEVSARLNDMGISIKPRTIYSWERGINQPTVDALMCLAHIYKLNSVLDAFGYPIESSDKNISYHES